jgi:dipeptidyl aminopeptidase/acylaminoacyl peptidase
MPRRSDSADSPIARDIVVTGTLAFSQLRAHEHDTYWLESRPRSDGRRTLVRHRSGFATDVTPSWFDVRSRVHEYGGGDYIVTPRTTYCTAHDDQNLYRCEVGAAPIPLTREPHLRFADGVYAPRALVVVCEDHRGAAPENYLARVDVDTGAVARLVSGADFYAYPRLSPDGRTLAWMSWSRRRMPWDDSELWIAAVTSGGALGERTRIAGGEGVSVLQPEWSRDGVLHYVCDADGWWQLYAWREGASHRLLPRPAEFGEPLWTLGASTYGFAADGSLVCRYVERGQSQVGIIDRHDARLRRLELPYSAVSDLRVDGDRAVIIATSPAAPEAVVEVDLRSGTHLVLATDRDFRSDPGCLSAPEHLEFSTTEGDTAYAFFYAPHRQESEGSTGVPPPLLIKLHGGPTGSATSALNLHTQFWTSRGVAVADLNYRGSSGYGRAYRRRLREQWGVFEVDDAIAAVKALSESGRIDANRTAIRGKSAGGFTALCALCRRCFHGAVSVNGISDLEALLDTHKFESGYLTWLIGPYPETTERYRSRSPLYRVSEIAAPVLLLQGRRDVVVQRSQSDRLAAALVSAGKSVRLVGFDQEGHAFRKRDSLERGLTAEHQFMTAIFERPVPRNGVSL